MTTHFQVDRYGFNRPVPKFDNRHMCHCVMCRAARAERLRQRRARQDWVAATVLFGAMFSIIYLAIA
jgi:hypothetical protein